ncbi:TQO small subunit DoxD [Maricaulis sp.]|uniref:TQO small subunit DoxD n=1 Tax=Maricaulis sp. TaxID=1486257 RepID=UPI0025BE9F88|nr:TQO small subunit DoxD [Maricaulis sp.]
MNTSEPSARAERFLPDWIVGGVIRVCLLPGLWNWGRANADVWPGVMPDMITAAAVWNIPLVSAAQTAQIAVWGAHLVAFLLLVGFLTRLVGLVLLAACAVHAFWIMPEAWTSVMVFAASGFYLFARGGGALSIDGAIVATLR